MIVHWAARYDLLIWFLTLGRERRFRERLLRPARLRDGEAVLDVGCGTGSLAIVARAQVGPSGSVAGVDASAPMIARARRKASRAGLTIDFREAYAEALPFPDASFDVVLSTVMLHHLRRATRAAAVAEMRRVLRPGGRVIVVDFAGAGAAGGGPVAHFHRHGHVRPRDLIDLVTGAGLEVVEDGGIGKWSLHFVVGRRTDVVSGSG